MSDYLLDTSFLSAFAPGRTPIPQHVQKWIAEQRERGSWHMSSIVILEVERGIAKLKRSGGHAKVERISRWFESLLIEFDQRILPVDVAIAREAGRLEDATIARGVNPGLADVLIAATARLNGLSVLTANVRHFAILDVPYLNPFAEGGPRA
ncbi:MAG: type II toxin-antitoxin system VapC family toxin [Mesorhizobium sp.]|uniref:type II toxin-antitoxin system VapC family toxin n=1 Tax=unclassified Mesorhizobium TaxID=325217 RepID=UPI000FCA0A63|nr:MULTISPECIES: type II toxin-antitoxin system VapC family toxin [unclassified Mesorhizobium]RUU33542.1 type II toxin-antitoxin system VapC family toxin [Mesorhizobium sp. M6A.T.Ce.TU.002.03.1.1]RUV02514.1 type II toxin-antitoxin system VapC family toxin [Mesorhizobium sp. M6A.T.Cr.TU.017.01.1.1]RWN70593.1 MAG: type II toxin-antitoxin system VapC family toxin [Mesorhizobium sp.]RWQ33647.1 MAG: type II toxin-antitoxin system VapC family toxin [Mesorhizobium sp.]RWQ43445.1 MAG: type II toxin-an